MSKVCALAILFLLCRGLYGQDPCAARMVRDVDVSKLDEVTKHSFLELIDNANYEEAQKVIEASKDASLVELIKAGDKTLDYKDFDVKRRDLLSHKSINEELGQASLRHSVSKKARTKYFDCVMARPGLIVAFRDEDDSHATARVRYNGAPGRAIEYEITVTDGTVKQSDVEKTKHKLMDGKTFQFDIERPAGHAIQVNVYAESSSMFGSAISAPPPEQH
jgi:hypothetical protein